MPTNSINVALPLGGTGDRLSVTDSGGQNQVAQNPAATTISWTLTGALAQADFVPMTAAEPGFSWASTTQPAAPPPGLFGGAVISNGGNTLSIVDNHLDATTNGEWIYILRVSYQGRVYATEVGRNPGGTIKNPVIINH